MDEDFFSPKAVVGKLDNIEQEMALYEERVFFLTRLLLLQEARLKSIQETKAVYLESLCRAAEAELLYGTD